MATATKTNPFAVKSVGDPQTYAELYVTMSDDKRYAVRIHASSFDYEERGGGTKIYVHGTSPEDFGIAEKPESYDDEPENNKRWKAYNRKEVEVMRFFVNQCLLRGLKQLGYPVELDQTPDIKFSRKCGCSCGCSPGFKSNGIIGAGRTHVGITVERKR